MNQSLYLESDNKLIGVIRNPYERAVSLYKLSYYWIGFDKWLLEENPATFIEVKNVAPSRIKQGDIVYADGSNFNPGSGEGIYFRNAAGSWVKL